MVVRTTTAALLLALVVPVSGGSTAQAASPRVIDVVPSRAPWGGRPTAPWVNRGDQVIHDDGRRVVIAPPLEDRLSEVWQAGDDYLAQDLADAVYRISADGSSALLASSLVLAADGLAVEDSGRRVAVAVWDPLTRDKFIDVLRVSDGAREARLATEVSAIHGFTDGVVTFVAPYRKDEGSYTRLSTWTVNRQRIDLGGRRLRDPAHVDVGAGLMSRAAYASPGKLRVLPLDRRGGARRPWTVAADALLGVSPNGRLAVTFQASGKDSSTEPGLLVVRDARTGAARRTFRISPLGLSGWESNRRFVVTAYEQRGRRSALVRLSVGGKVERVSGSALNEGARLITS